MTGWTETATRPSGRRYQARKRPHAVPYGDFGPSYGIVVIRTHDIDVSVALAQGAWNYYHGDGEPLPPPVRGWTRIVPWDTGGGGDWSWDSCTGHESGSVPCVWFDSNDYRDLLTG